VTLRDSEAKKYSQCSMFNALGDKTPCTNGWQYDHSDFDSTIPSAYNWVCEKSGYATWSLTITAVGNAVGTVVLGAMADRLVI